MGERMEGQYEDEELTNQQMENDYVIGDTQNELDGLKDIESMEFGNGEPVDPKVIRELLAKYESERVRHSEVLESAFLRFINASDVKEAKLLFHELVLLIKGQRDDDSKEISIVDANGVTINHKAYIFFRKSTTRENERTERYENVSKKIRDMISDGITYAQSRDYKRNPVPKDRAYMKDKDIYIAALKNLREEGLQGLKDDVIGTEIDFCEEVLEFTEKAGRDSVKAFANFKELELNNGKKKSVKDQVKELFEDKSFLSDKARLEKNEGEYGQDYDMKTHKVKKQKRDNCRKVRSNLKARGLAY